MDNKRVSNRPRRPFTARRGPVQAVPTRGGKQACALTSLNAVLKPHLRRSANGRKVVSHATVADRSFFFSKLVRELHALGYQLTDVHHLKPRHIEALMRAWEQAGLSASTLQKRFSYLTLLCGWIGKASMLRPAASYLADPAAYQRGYIATYDHSWTARGIDPLEKIAEIAADEPAVARVLRLQWAFGLRLQEAALLNPARDALDTAWLRVVAGTKGGRPRTVPIETDAQRAILAEAADYAAITKRSMIPPDYDLKAWLAHVYHVLARQGITCQNGLVTHGLRHQYANDRYEELTGEPSPVRGGDRLADAASQHARQNVTARLGHARVGITNAYYGKAPAASPDVPTPPSEAHVRARDIRVQQRLLTVRLAGCIDRRQSVQGAIATTTVHLRWRLLNRMLVDLHRAGVPLSTPEALNEIHIDTLLRGWQTGRLSVASAKNNQRLLLQLCGWLERPDLALRVRTMGAPAASSSARPTRPWPEHQIQERLAAIRAQNARVALHIELVRAIGLTHRQAALWQRQGADHAGCLDVLWDTPKHQVLRFTITTDAQQAVITEAQRLLPQPDDTVCPAEVSVSNWLRTVYDGLRHVGGIGIPGAPTLAALRAPDAPTPLVLDREAYLMARAGLRAPTPQK